MTAPCKDCPNREMGCHAKCAKYQEYRQNRDEQIKAHLKEIDSDAVQVLRYSRIKGRRDRHG